MAIFRSSKQIIRKATGCFWLRFIAWHGLMTIGLFLAAATAMVITRPRNWLTGATVAIAILLTTLAAALYFVRLNRALWKLDRMPSKSVRFTFTDDALGMESDTARSEVAWQMVERIWRFRDVWLLFVAKSVYVALPIVDLDQNVRDFIVDRVIQHGGRVR